MRCPTAAPTRPPRQRQRQRLCSISISISAGTWHPSATGTGPCQHRRLLNSTLNTGGTLPNRGGAGAGRMTEPIDLVPVRSEVPPYFLFAPGLQGSRAPGLQGTHHTPGQGGRGMPSWEQVRKGERKRSGRPGQALACAVTPSRLQFGEPAKACSVGTVEQGSSPPLHGPIWGWLELERGRQTLPKRAVLCQPC
jgi:hypothetical protein